jgi:hypothetical protein
MKKIFFIIAGFYSVSLIAQNEVDALRYSDINYGGTSRFMSMGSAFGSLGGDMSAISVNPASLGIYRSSELTITPYFSYNQSSAMLQGTSLDDYKFRFQLGNAGIVGTHLNGDENKWKSVSFAFSYNRLNDFNSYTRMQGYNNTSSMTDYFAAIANGKETTAFDNFNEGLAWDAYLIDPDSSSTNKYKTALPNYGELQVKDISTKGGMGEYVFAIGGNYDDKLYLGMSLGIQTIRYSETSEYSEVDTKDSIKSFNYFNYNKYLKTTGSGFNFKFGLIYRPMDWFRIGFAVHTPTFFNLSDSYHSSITSSFNDTLHGDGLVINSPDGSYDYELTTPFRAIASTSFLINKIAAISVEYEYVDYSVARLRASDYFFRGENDAIENSYTAVGILRAGAEFKTGPISFRCGYGFYPSPFKKGFANENADKSIYSFGIGIRGDESYFDIGFSYSTQKEKYYLYDTSVIPNAPATVTHNNIGLIATFGFKF